MKDLLQIAYKAIDEKQGENIVVLDFKGQSAFVDYFIICSSNNIRKANAIADYLEEEVYKNYFTVKSRTKNKDARWILIDLGEVVCHIFVNEERELYNLEGLWKDLPLVKM